jgi:hypothetical protein
MIRGQFDMQRSFHLILPLLLAAACGDAPPPPSQASLGAPPAELCRKNREALDKLQASGTFEYDAEGGATIEHQLWLRMGDSNRTRLGQSIAFNAACAAGELAPEQTALVRSETGMVLMQRIFPMTSGTVSLLDE